MNESIVSILIPVFNRQEFIGQCIESALAQTYPYIEIVVVDNASTDGTWEVCQHYARKDSRVRIYQNSENVGPVRNWLACVDHARGNYIKILWSDDCLHPNFLEKTIPCLINADVGFAYTSAYAFSENPKNIICKLYTSFGTGFYNTNFFIESSIVNRDVPYSPGCALFRAKDVRSNLLLNIPNQVDSDFGSHAIGNDLLLFLITANQYKKFAIINEPLSYFRVHDNSITTSAPKGKIMLHYNIAKGFFVDMYIVQKTLIKKFNSESLIIYLKYRRNNFGIRGVSWFYPRPTKINYDFNWLIRRLFCKLFAWC